MISIRKFVGYPVVAAGIAAGLALGLSVQTGVAAVQEAPLASAPIAAHTTTLVAPSAACTAAVNALKAWVAADRTEDAAEREVAKTNPETAADVTEDTAEHAAVKPLWTAVRTACAPAIPRVVKRTFTPSAACTAAVQALKAAWAQGRPTSKAQWTQLQTLFQNVRTACGWRDMFGDHDRR
jgi:hypothetical protein